VQRWIKGGLYYSPRTELPWINSHAAVPTIVPRGEGVMRVYFSPRDSRGHSHIGWFDFDLEQPEKIINHSVEPVLSPSSPGMFDDSGTMVSWLIEHEQRQYLYYIGWNPGGAVPFRNAIGLAVSQDQGASFQRVSNGPVLDRSIYDPCMTASCCVLIEHGLWRMWYLSGIDWVMRDDKLVHYYHIKYAESENGIDWHRIGRVAIDFKDAGEYAISRPCVVKEDGIYRMWYSYRGVSYRIGYAESTDGLSWKRRDSEVDLDVSPSGWDSEMIEYPFVFEYKDRKYMFYNGNGYGKSGIGYAVLDK
jgi:hypothetical protein